MIELRLHRALYAGTAVDEAARVFGPYAAIALREEPEHWVVGVTVADPDHERTVAGELANYALGRTVQRRPSDLAAGAAPGAIPGAVPGAIQ